MPYHQVKHPLNFIYLSCLLDRGLIMIVAFSFCFSMPKTIRIQRAMMTTISFFFILANIVTDIRIFGYQI